MKTNVSQHPSSDAVQRNVAQASTTLHNTIDKVADPLHTAVDAATFTAHHAVDSVAEGTNRLVDSVAEQTKRVGQSSRRALDYGRAYVQEHPIQAVAGVFVAGLVLGRLAGALAQRRDPR